MTINQISIFLENRPGQLAEITQDLNDAGINMMAINIAEASEYGLIRIIVDDCDKAESVLKENGFLVTVTKVTSVGVSDKPGGLNDVAKIISEAGINIEYMYSLLRERDGIAYMIFKTDDPEKLEKVLTSKGIF